MTKIRVAQLSSVHPPFDVRIFLKESRSLANAGYDVQLIAQHDRKEVVDGVRVVPIRKTAGRTSRFFIGSVRVLLTALTSGATIFHFHDPELIPVALFLKVFGNRVIYDVHEDLPRQIMDKHWIRPGIRSTVSRVAAWLERLAGYAFDLIVVATPTIAKRFPTSKTVLVRNFPLLDELAEDDASNYIMRPPVVAYVGGLNMPRGALEMVKAIGLVDASLGANLSLAGPIFPHSVLERMESEPGWAMTRWHGVLDRSGVRNLLSFARVGLVTLHPTSAFLPSLPVKMFEYMSAGIPVIVSDFPMWREIVDGAGAGILVDPLDPLEIARAIEWLLTHPDEARQMGERGRKAVRDRYNWRSEEAKLLAAYRTLSYC